MQSKRTPRQENLHAVVAQHPGRRTDRARTVPHRDVEHLALGDRVFLDSQQPCGMDGIIGHQMKHSAALEIEGQEIDFLARQQVTQTGQRPGLVLQTKD